MDSGLAGQGPRPGMTIETADNAKADKFAKGRIALQHGKGVNDESSLVKFRKVEIRTL